MKDGHHILQDGTIRYFRDGVLHRRKDCPAVIKPNGLLEYWANGVKIKDYDAEQDIGSMAADDGASSAETARISSGNGPTTISVFRIIIVSTVLRLSSRAISVSISTASRWNSMNRC